MSLESPSTPKSYAVYYWTSCHGQNVLFISSDGIKSHLVSHGMSFPSASFFYKNRCSIGAIPLIASLNPLRQSLRGVPRDQCGEQTRQSRMTEQTGAGGARPSEVSEPVERWLEMRLT